PPSAGARVGDVPLRSFLGAGADLSGDGALAPLLARFGLGFVEVDARGPVPDAPVPVAARLPHVADAGPEEATRARCALVARLAPRVAFFTLEPPPERAWPQEAWAAHLAAVGCAAADAGRPLVLVARTAEDVRRLGATGHPVLAAARVAEPADALALRDAGATLVALDRAGLAAAGPGLPKRVHEAVQHRAQPPPRRGPQGAWVATFLLGVGMMVAGAVAWGVAATRVILPYDEAFVGMTRDELAAVNERLLPFLAHDRITLAGTMVSIGVLYAMLAWHAQRDGAHWAHRTVAVSAAVGFASFFLYLAYGYFDPLHAFIALLLLPFFLAGLRGPAGEPPRVPVPDLRNDRAWRRALRGQLAFVTLGVGLVLAGLYVSVVGSTRVFVAEDLAFLQTSAEAVRAANPRLPALIAHDRAGLGGALVSDGLAVLLLALWGVRRGAAWVWWALLLAGAAGFAGALGVHAAVGYTDARHLAPALLALAVWGAGLAWTRAYLRGPPA
ncbi:MAG TPA: hypothetical protein VNX21_03935, partial [Candidatus Thermoplasmatota archaeon]|nr:hypothetical protein [Candidatus Thermoplasmatota archaeon]